jgi:ArsR family transcriptional regulator
MASELTTACCTPVSEGVLSEAEAVDLSTVFKALSDPARLRLLSMIASSPEREMCACDLIEPVGKSQPTVSHHLSQLVDAGLLQREKRGRWAWFRIDPARLAEIRAVLG